jgi:hypothetical protein
MRDRQGNTACPRRAYAQTSAELGAFRPASLQRRSSNRSPIPELRGTAREVCVARYYDPATGQFLSIDPDVALTDAPFNYAGDDPVNESDPTGLSGVSSYTETECELYGDNWVPHGSTPGVGTCLAVHRSSWLSDVGHFIAKHRKAIEVGAGIALGIVAAGTGIGALVEGATLTGVLLGAGSVAAGAGASALDYSPCVHGHDTAACVGFGLGATSVFAGGAGLAGSGLVVEGAIGDDTLTASTLGGLGAFGWVVGTSGTVIDATTGVASASPLPC